MTYWKTEHFKALQKSWYQRLEEAGFKDAEELIADEMVLKQVSAHAYCRADALERETKAAYYRLLSSVAAKAKYRSEVDRVIMLMRSEGMKIQHICESLGAMGLRRHRRTIRFTIRRYETQWGLRIWTPKQLRRVG